MYLFFVIVVLVDRLFGLVGGGSDDLLADFLETDVVHLVMTYTHSVSRRAAYVERFGNSGGNKSFGELIKRKDVKNQIAANPTRYNTATQQGRVNIIKELANPREDHTLELLLKEASHQKADGFDIRFMRNAVESVTGRLNKEHFGGVMEWLSGKTTYLTHLLLMSKSVATQINEPITVFMRTRSVKAAAATFADYFGEAVSLIHKSKNWKDRARLARAIGLTTSQLYDNVMLNNLGRDFATVHSSAVADQRFFGANLLTPVTNAQKRSVMAGGTFWMQDLALQYLDRKTGPAQRKRIEAEFKELGVPQANIADLAAWLTSRDGLPTLDEIDTKAGALWQQAIGRFADQVIQNPRRADKPIMASSPVGRVCYALTSFLYTFHHNVNVAYYNRLKRDYRIGRDTGMGKVGAGLFAAGDFVKGGVFGYAALFASQYLVTMAREGLLNGEQWEKHRKAGELDEWLFELAFSRTGALGPIDPVVQAFSALRYDRDLSSLFTGPGVAYYLSNIQNIATGLGIGGYNSPKNNTAERNAVKSAYRLFVAPTMTWLLTGLETLNWAGAAVRWGAMAGINSNNAAEGLADVLVGEANAKGRNSDDGPPKARVGTGGGGGKDDGFHPWGIGKPPKDADNKPKAKIGG